MELVIKNLSKSYKQKDAVKNVELKLTPGIWGLLGANGAGKTTLMRMTAGILEPTRGAVLYCGRDIRNNVKYRSEFGFLPQEIRFGKDLTVVNYLEYIAALKNVPLEATKKRIDRLLEILISFRASSPIYRNCRRSGRNPEFCRAFHLQKNSKCYNRHGMRFGPLPYRFIQAGKAAQLS